MKLKVNEEGLAFVVDGKPVYLAEDGKEIPFDVLQTTATITRLNAEAKSHREKFESAEKTLKSFEGISDPQAALKALETLANLDSKKLIDAGEVDRVKAEISKGYEAQLSAEKTRAQTLEQQLYGEKIGGSFARSKLIAEKLAIPADLVQARFGNAFKIEDNNIIAYDPTGNKVFSRARPGEVANFEEALEFLIDQYPHKDSILKGSGAGGSGAGNKASADGSNARTMTRAQFESASDSERMAFSKAGGKVAG